MFGTTFHGVELCARSTTIGKVTVKVEPLPASLLTAMSPPMSWQNLRLMARPRPVPPYFLLVELSACSNA